VSNNDTAEHSAEARRRVQRAKSIGWKALRERHEAWWAKFWQRSWVALPDAVRERPWYWGLYRAASARPTARQGLSALYAPVASVERSGMGPLHSDL